ncbi:hypothetical protein F3Y22_tig00109945pilonHSYRG00059 [Hibiscus syriacus]|uniref:Reverse transcriptase Ty1/copia-type domain-containing protein n=1 Tax=Hibiscus syriacus TaxID=106335 RepID=A0A6A3BRK0_HIBSY|nr:hypothetical protein F3Y22_tig00109945pilonHSYRG00059 [Hibiscus syriacus]
MTDRFSVTVNGLKAFGEIIPNEKLVRKIIDSLPKSWQSKKIAIIKAKDLKSLTLGELIGSLITHEMMIQDEVDHKKKDDTKKETEKKKKISHYIIPLIEEDVTIDDVESDETGNDFATTNTTDVEAIKTKTLVDVYERSNFIFVEPNSFSEASKSTFLNGELEDDICVSQPEGFVVVGKEHQVYKEEATLYIKKSENVDLLVVSLYVDDLLVMRSNVEVVSTFKLSMQEEFEMSNLDLMSYFLGMKINQNEASLFISHKKNILDVLRKFKLESCKGVDSSLPLNLKLSKNNGEKLKDTSIFGRLVGSSLYSTATWPDLVFLATLLSRFMSSQTDVHLGVSKRVLRTKHINVKFHAIREAEKNVQITLDLFFRNAVNVTWEELEGFYIAYSNYELEEKLFFHGVANVVGAFVGKTYAQKGCARTAIEYAA